MISPSSLTALAATADPPRSTGAPRARLSRRRRRDVKHVVAQIRRGQDEDALCRRERLDGRRLSCGEAAL